jgi:ribosome-associated protein
MMPALPPPLEPLEAEIEFSAIRAQGAGGQNVNKVSNAVHLRFDIAASSLPDEVKLRLLAMSPSPGRPKEGALPLGGTARSAKGAPLTDQRISGDGVVVIKAQAHRSLEMNRADAVERLRELIAQAAHVPKRRRATRPTRASQRRRVEGKVQRGQIKALRGKVSD